MTMMKCEILLESATVQNNNSPVGRIAGWSEGFYHANDIYSQDHTLELCRLRAACLGATANVVGQRYQIVDPVGGSSVGANIFPGSSLWIVDVPQNALYLQAGSNTLINKRKVMMAGLPDFQSKGGQYSPTSPFDSNLQAYMAYIASGRWYFRAKDKSVAVLPIFSISTVGLVTTGAPHSFTAWQKVRILRARDAEHNLISGVYVVLPGVTTNTFSINLTLGTAATGGTVRTDSMSWIQINTCVVKYNTVRKVGKNFFSYHGRASTRR
jgi:hypothetical protein